MLLRFPGCRSMLHALGTSPWRLCTSRHAYRLSSPHTVMARLQPWSPCLDPRRGCRHGDDAGRAVRSQGRTSFLHESSSVTSATRPRRQISKPCSEKWVRSRKSFFRSTASPIDRVDSPSSSSGMRQRSPRRSRNSTAPSSTDEISGSARPGTVRHGHPEEGGSWTTARRPWTSGGDPPNRKAAVAVFEAENADSRSVSALHATRRRP